MNNEIFISLKPEFADLIQSRKKNHEFRTYLPKQTPSRIWIYIKRPIGELKYIADVNPYIEYPKKIEIQGIGNKEFNSGFKKSKIAFPIIHLYEINTPLHINELRNKFNFTAPQKYTYTNKYLALVDFILNKCKIKKVF